MFMRSYVLICVWVSVEVSRQPQMSYPVLETVSLAGLKLASLAVRELQETVYASSPALQVPSSQPRAVFLMIHS